MQGPFNYIIKQLMTERASSKQEVQNATEVANNYRPEHLRFCNPLNQKSVPTQQSHTWIRPFSWSFTTFLNAKRLLEDYPLFYIFTSIFFINDAFTLCGVE